MTWRYRLYEAAMIAICWPALWSILHYAEGRPLLGDFYMGAIITGVGLRLLDALYAATTPYR